jgi:hypothetical protein
LRNTIGILNGLGYDAHLILGDSTDPAIIAQAAAFGPFDACFIDANHTLPYVTKDWENYGPLARIVAFHDIGYRQPPGGRNKGIEVPIFWDAIKGGFRHEECLMDVPHNGIGVLWRD